MLVEAEDRRPPRGVVATDAFEDSRPVVQAVHADVDPCIGPVDELAVHPDLLGLLHGKGSFSVAGSAEVYPREVRSKDVAPESRWSSGGPIAAMCDGLPAPIQTSSKRKKLRSIRVLVTARRGNGATPPGSKPVACSTSWGRAMRTSDTSSARPIAPSSARASPGTSAST